LRRRRHEAVNEGAGRADLVAGGELHVARITGAGT
jgi:hypothetical protein